MNDGRRVRAGVLAAVQRVRDDALAKIACLVAGLHTFVNRFGQRLTPGSGGRDRDLGPLLDKDDGQARVLAQGDHVPRRDAGVLHKLTEHASSPRIGFPLRGPLQGSIHIRRQLMTGRHTERLHRLYDLLEFNRSHDSPARNPKNLCQKLIWRRV